jgi:hypothetical protein
MIYEGPNNTLEDLPYPLRKDVFAPAISQRPRGLPALTSQSALRLSSTTSR